MHKGRLEAFSDGVFAIIITIMVLELKAPHEATFAALAALGSKFSSYLLSFVFVGIYWNHHHHLLQATRHVDGRALWANMHLLFWLSLVPFVTDFMGENHFAPLAVALGKDRKGFISMGCYVAAVALAWVSVWVSGALLIFVALMWLVPDPRIEKTLGR